MLKYFCLNLIFCFSTIFLIEDETTSTFLNFLMIYLSAEIYHLKKNFKSSNDGEENEKSRFLFLAIFFFFMLVVGVYTKSTLTSKGVNDKPESVETSSSLVDGRHYEDNFCQVDFSNFTNENIKDISELTRSFLLKMQKDNISENSIDYISMMFKINVVRGRMLRDGYKTNITVPPYANSDYELATSQIMSAVQHLIDEGDYSYLKNLIIDGKVTGRTFFATDGELLTILSKIIKDSPDGKEQVISLIDDGVEPTASDLMYLSKNVDDKFLIDYMYRNSKVKKGEKYLHLGTYHSFLLESIYYGKFENAMYWLSMDDDPEPDSMMLNAIDALVFAKDRFDESSDLYTLVNKLYDKKINPNIEETLNFISKNYPDFKFNQDYMFSLSRDEQHDVDKYSDMLLSSTLNYLKSVGLINVETVSCDQNNVADIIKYSLDKNNSNEVSKKSSKKTDSSNADYKELLSKFGTPEAVEEYLGRYQTISSKKDVYKFRMSRLLESAKSLRDVNVSNEMSSEKLDAGNKLNSLMKTGKWDDAIKLFNEDEIFDGEDDYSAFLGMVISNNPPVSILEKLFSSGEKVPDSAVLAVASFNNIDMAKFLLKKGLNLNYTDAMGSDAVLLAAQFGSIDMLKFLIESGQSVSSDSQTFDALDVAISQYNGSQSSKEIIDVILKSGIVIEPSHRQSVQQFMDNKDLASYSFFATQHPELLN
ncbi:ankyrin repeat domain-containing protein [Shewanella psychrotolerans]|uniref:ankyrin repeat domain-containing protein n=1 Tax=Shewanella psychrotolerans TaxID=2864206 RepID=UPI001C65B090|nr:ankyrin repeat domain-containing protein [Shewanella psychrotolerans]QYK01271.1 ankyrin repeat domain-containing protein [Shewanella psychrotolerans]